MDTVRVEPCIAHLVTNVEVGTHDELARVCSTREVDDAHLFVSCSEFCRFINIERVSCNTILACMP